MRASGPGRSPAAPSPILRWISGAGAILALVLGSVTATEDAVANGDTRTLSLYHTHTQESISITFRRDGRYDAAALEQLNWFLRDWRVEQKTRMDPRLFDTVWQLYRSVGASEPIHIISAYRSPGTNAALRARSRRVSEHSQHMAGKAMDLQIPDVPVERVRANAMRLQNGGVGYYAGAFVHVDVGSVRAWPRMTRDQLVRLFPDGKTVHLPADGKPLPGYDQARAELLGRGVTVQGETQVAEAGEGSIKTFFASLFSGNADRDEDTAIAAAPARAPARGPQLAAVSRTAEAGTRGALAFAPETTAAFDRARIDGRPAARMSADASAADGAETAARLPAKLALAPLPPRRPDEFAAYTALAVAPTPPARPLTLVASADPDALPILTTLRPLEKATMPPLGPVKTADTSLSDRSHVRALFVKAATVARAALGRVRFAATRSKGSEALPAGALAPAETATAQQFSSGWNGGPSPARFAGPAVATVASLR